MNNIVERTFNYLGKTVIDKVTKYSGIVTSVSFDLYGCIQCLVHPGLDSNNKLQDQNWFDINRLEISVSTPVMPLPKFTLFDTGPTEKPILNKS